MSPSDRSLVDRWLAARDAAAFREIVARHASLVYATSRRILRDPAAAEDVTQDCFLKLCEAISPPRSLPAWLHRVATHRSLDRLRATRRRREHETRRAEALARETAAGDPEGRMVWRETERLVDEAIASLPEELREPLVRRYLEGEASGAIASDLRISRNTVTARLRRGIDAVRDHLSRRGVSIAPALLVGGLSSIEAAAAPPEILASLGKLAIAGGRGSVAGAAASGALRSTTRSIVTTGGSMKIVSGSLAVIVAITIVWSLTRDGRDAATTPAGGDDAGTPVAAAPSPESRAASEEETALEPAPEPDQPSPEATEGTEGTEALAVVAGTVRTNQGEPVAGAEVRIVVHPEQPKRDLLGSDRMAEEYWQLARSRVATSGEDGSYRIEGIPWTGPATATVFADGLAGSAKHVKLEAGARVEGTDFSLTPGQEILGRLVTAEGQPVTDALVSVYYAWHPKDMVWGASLGRTDEEGRFALTLVAEAERLSLRANSRAFGQDFFLDLAIPDPGDELELRLHDTATVRGTITWPGGVPAAGLFVAFRAAVPEPRISVSYSGIRPTVFLEQEVGADGRYELSGLPPGLTCNVFVLPPGEDRLAAHRKALSSQWKHPFTLKEGEVKVWDYEAPRLSTVRGRVVTDVTGRPVPRIGVGVRRDGKPISGLDTETDEEGRFELPINTGPGEYVVHAQPQYGAEGPGRVIAERYGETITLAGGDEVELELRVFEPIVLPIRVERTDGEPVRSIRTQLDYWLPDGKRHGLGDSRSLDEEGRSKVLLHFPVKEFTLEVGCFPSGPKTPKRTFRAAPGQTLPEEVFRLPRTADVAGTVVAPDGAPLANRWVRIDVTGADGTRERISPRSDQAGHFDLKGRFRAEVVDVRIRVDGVEGEWVGKALDATEGRLDLGEVTVAGPES